jgi:8-oxo-dGTP pyrophosphatase MutT (NUDIX family)
LSKPTHAGGLVVKRDREIYRYLIVRPKKDKTQWVLPKGHIESGEHPSETAVREVREETGIEARPLSRVDSIAFQYNGEEIHVVFFLLEYVREVPKEEQREVRWCTYAEAMKLLTFDDSKRLLGLVQSVVQKHFPSG